MNDLVTDFLRSNWCASDVFVRKLEILKNSGRSSKNYHLTFNLSVVAFHSGRFKMASENFKKLLSESNFNITEQAEIVLALSEIYLLTGQFMKVLDLTSKILKALQTHVEKAQEECNINDLVSRLHLVNLRAHVILRNFDCCRFDDEVLYLSKSPAITKWLCSFLKAQFEYYNGRLQSASRQVMQAEYDYCQVEYDATKADDKETASQEEALTEAAPTDSTINSAYDLVESSESLNRFFLKYGYCRACLKYNALGCVFARMNKPTLALLYFQKAFDRLLTTANGPRSSKNQGQPALQTKMAADGKNDRSSKSTNAASVPVFGRSQVARLSLMYNFGLMYLANGEASRAFDYLIEVVAHVNNNSRLWLRLAECCIMAQKNNHSKVDKAEQNGYHCRVNNGILKGVIGVGPHRKIVINTDLSIKIKTSSEHGAMPTLSLEFAYFCLKNALTVLPDVDESDVNDSVTANRGSCPAPLGPPMTAKEALKVKCSILCAAAYVCLFLGEHQSTLQCSKNLLNLKSVITKEQEILGRLYAAEASVLLNKTTEAFSFLKLDPTLQQRWFKGDASDWAAGVHSFKLVMHYNAAVACALYKDYDRATQIVATIAENVKDLPVQCASLNMYIQLQKGHLNDVKQYLTKLVEKSGPHPSNVQQHS